MDLKRERPVGEPGAGYVRALTNEKPLNPTPKRPTKEGRIFRILVERGATGLDSFEAARYGDRHLHSTVSALQRKHGLTIQRVFKEVPGWQGIKTRICVYWLEGDDLERAERILERDG